MLRFIYNTFKQSFWDFLVEDFYNFIPESLKEPSVDFLAGGKDKLERFWSIQAYNMQRRSIMDNKNADVYKGILIIIRAQLILLSKGGKVKIEPVGEKEKETDLAAGIEDFVKMGKERFGEGVKT